MSKKSNPLPQNLHAPRLRQLADEACLSFLKEVGEMRGIGALFADEAGDTLSELDQWRKVINILVDGPADWFVGCRFYPSTTSSSEDMIVCLCDLKTHEQTNYHLTQKTDLVYSICLSRIPTHSNLAAVKDLYRWLYDFYAKRKNYDGFGNDAWSLYRRISDKYSSQAKRLRDDAISIVDAAAKSSLADQEGQTGLLRGNGETDNSNETAKPVSNIGITAKVKGKADDSGRTGQPKKNKIVDTDELEKRVRVYIKNKPRYIPLREIAKIIGFSKDTINKKSNALKAHNKQYPKPSRKSVSVKAKSLTDREMENVSMKLTTKVDFEQAVLDSNQTDEEKRETLRLVREETTE
jgi:hypothetical protein